MKIPIWQVDAFASQVFAGNPAAVCLLEAWFDDRVLQNIAAENNLSETAFLVRNAEGFDLRWFTPVTEVELCGHATLASGHVVLRAEPARQRVTFATRKAAENDALARRVAAQEAEVRALSRWAKATRERNHLTELFMQSTRRANP